MMHKLKVCIHNDNYKMCEVTELPFQPEEDQVLILHPSGTSEDFRISMVVNGLLYDHSAGYWIMRPDYLDSIEKQMKSRQTLVQDNFDLIP